MFYVYILYSNKHSKSYVGFTADVQRRLQEHNAKKVRYTSRYVPWVVLFIEEFNLKSAAVKREKYLKSAAGRRWMKAHINWPRGATE